MKIANTLIKKDILRFFIESPFYFTMPIRERLEFINFFSQQSVYLRLCAYGDTLINVRGHTSLRNLEHAR